MKSSFRRFEILLPLQYNDGRQVPYQIVGQAVLEVKKRFGAVSHESQVISGSWDDKQQTFHDQLTRFYVDVPDVAGNLDFFVHFKEMLKQRFEQLEIWIVTFPIEIL